MRRRGPQWPRYCLAPYVHVKEGESVRAAIRFVPAVFLAGMGAVFACSGSGSSAGAGPAPGQTGASCANASACYPGIDAATLQGGQATCLTQLQGGYCTHTCATDTDCCAVPGECPYAFKEICAPFESSGNMFCFLSCASADIATDADASTTDPATFCQRWGNPTFTCRSTGGGHNNRQFCGP